MLVFKWQEFAHRIHLTSCIFHFIYVFILALYVNEVYINATTENARLY